MRSIAKSVGLYLLAAILGFVLGALVLYTIKVRSGPELEIWHSEELAAEFTTRDADEIRRFDAYLALEEELFAQLEEQVVARVGTGRAFALERYSSGSGTLAPMCDEGERVRRAIFEPMGDQALLGLDRLVVFA